VASGQNPRAACGQGKEVSLTTGSMSEMEIFRQIYNLRAFRSFAVVPKPQAEPDPDPKNQKQDNEYA
jgi:hypothetical protein